MNHSVQTHFATHFSTPHFGDQNFLHRDVHHHLLLPDNRHFATFHQNNHQPYHPGYGQTTLQSWMPVTQPGLW